MSPPAHAGWVSALAISLGASAGALLRWRLGLWLSTPGALLPWGTLAANWGGGYLVGLMLAILHTLPQLDPLWRATLITGFLGALTTFSSFSAEVFTLAQQQRWALAGSLVALHLLGTLALTWVGWHSWGWWR